jgi:hypothetical protein
MVNRDLAEDQNAHELVTCASDLKQIFLFEFLEYSCGDERVK